jgi:hypothetical protein
MTDTTLIQEALKALLNAQVAQLEDQPKLQADQLEVLEDNLRMANHT